MAEQGYWIAPDGEIIDVATSTHVGYMSQNLEKFGYKPEDRFAIYQKWGERPGMEGRARVEMVSKAYALGWIRIREYSRENYISVQSKEFDEKMKMNLLNWVKDQPNPDTTVEITEFKPLENVETNIPKWNGTEYADNFVKAEFWVDDIKARVSHLKTTVGALQKGSDFITNKDESNYDMATYSGIMKYMRDNPGQKIFSKKLKIRNKDILKYTKLQEFVVILESLK